MNKRDGKQVESSTLIVTEICLVQTHSIVVLTVDVLAAGVHGQSFIWLMLRTVGVRGQLHADMPVPQPETQPEAQPEASLPSDLVLTNGPRATRRALSSATVRSLG